MRGIATHPWSLELETTTYTGQRTKRKSGPRPGTRLLAAEAANRASFWEKVNLLGYCWEWSGATTEWGYGKLRYGGLDFTAHRCSYEYQHGRIPSGLWVLHRCDNPPCINPAHLFLGNPVDNTQDMMTKGRAGHGDSRGERNPAARVSESQVVEIRTEFAQGATPADLAERFALTSGGINAILRGKTWKDAGGPICVIDRRGLYKTRKIVVALPKIQEVGRLTSDPVLKWTPNGKAVVTLNVAFNKRVKDRETGEWRDAGALFVRCTAWDQMAENCSETLSKGDEVFVSGELSMREYDRTDGSGKGQSLELNLYAVGPNLFRATAKVNKATRSSEASTSQVDDPWSTAPTKTSPAATFDGDIPF